MHKVKVAAMQDGWLAGTNGFKLQSLVVDACDLFLALTVDAITSDHMSVKSVGDCLLGGWTENLCVSE